VNTVADLVDHLLQLDQELPVRFGIGFIEAPWNGASAYDGRSIVLAGDS
jgi:hypothetical protein